MKKFALLFVTSAFLVGAAVSGCASKPETKADPAPAAATADAGEAPAAAPSALPPQ